MSLSGDCDAKRRRLHYKRSWIKLRRETERFNFGQNPEPNISEFQMNDANTQETPILPVLSDHENSSEIQNEESSSSDVQDDCESEDENEIIDLLEERVVSSSDSEFDFDDSFANSLQKGLVKWANDNQVKHKAVDDLLKLMNKHFDTDLPSSARTLLKTARDVHVSEKSGMEYINLGFKDQLLLNMSRCPSDVISTVETLKLSLNIDGIPVFKSTNSSLWPVLCSINLEKKVVFPVLLLYGPSKPRNLDFLSELCEELKDILEDGITFKDTFFPVELFCIVCDAPAKAMVKGIKQFSGYYGCDMCDQKGNWLGRITYQQISNLNKRTNHSFRHQTQLLHHHKVTPFCDLNIDMIKSFPIDYMHQVCLGVMKRLLLLWTKGPRNIRISSQQQHLISNQLKQFRSYIPTLFARKPRGLDTLERWKATEFRQFLLYSGRYVLKGIIRDELFNHFLTLSIAISILVSDRLSNHVNYAHQLLTYFVSEGRNIYGPEFLVYNVHSLLHLKEVVNTLGSLDSCSAFAFESYMQVLKRFVRSGKEPLKQIVKRLLELQETDVSVTTKNNQKIRTSFPNNIYIVENTDKVCEVLSVSSERDEQGEKKKLCRVYKRPKSVFETPCDSRLVGYFSCQRRLATLEVLPNRSLQRQAIMIDTNNERQVLFMGVLHDA